MRRALGQGAPRRRWRWSVIGTAALVPVYPAGAVAVALVLSVTLLRNGHDASPSARRERWVILALAGVGILTQLASSLVWPTPSPLAAAPLPLDASARPNLLAAHDASWLRGWSRAHGLGPYASPREDAFWRLERSLGDDGASISELVSAFEVPLAAETPYTVSAVIRHDGDAFSATFMERTRTERARVETNSTPLSKGMLRLDATLAPNDGPVRLRSLHLVDLGGDWTYVEVGWPTLSAGETLQGYAPYANDPVWYAGLGWWLGLAATLLAAGTAGRAAATRIGTTPIAIGLTVGLGAQAALALQDLVRLGAKASRASGTLGDPNLLAHVAVITALAVMALAPRAPRLGAVALALALACVLASGSRAGALGLLLAALVVLPILVPGLRSWRRRWPALLPVAGVAVVLLVAGAPVHRLVQPLAGDVNLQARQQAWSVAWSAASARPLLGLGHERFGLAYEFAQPHEPGPRYRNTHPHNAALYLAAGSGFLVATAFTAAVAAVMVRAVRRRAWIALLVIGTALMLNLVDATLFHAAVALPAWVPCCVIASGRRDHHA